MDWGQVLTIAISNLGMFLWATRQARTDFHQTLRMIESQQKEIKELHGKVCILEDRSKNGLDKGISNRKSKSNDIDVGRNPTTKR